MMDRDHIKKVIEGYEVHRNEFVDTTISEVVAIFNEILGKQFPGIKSEVFFNELHDKWVVIVGPVIYSGYDMSIVAFGINEKNVEAKITLSEGLGDDITSIHIDAFLGDKIAEILAKIFKSNVFKSKIGIYSELSSKEKYDLTIFDQEIFRYLPSDLHLFVKKEWIIALRNCDSEIRLVDYEDFHKPEGYTYYIGKFGVVNGFKFKLLRVENNEFVIKKIN